MAEWIGPSIKQLNEIARLVVENAPKVAKDTSLLAKYYMDVVGRTCSPQQVVDYLGSTRVMEAGRGFVRHVGPALKALEQTALTVPRAAVRHFDKLAATGTGLASTTKVAVGTKLAAAWAVLFWATVVIGVGAGIYMYVTKDTPDAEPVEVGYRTQADPLDVTRGAQEAPSFSVITITGTRGFPVVSVRPTWKVSDGMLRWNQIRSGGTRSDKIPRTNIREHESFPTREAASAHVGRMIDRGNGKIFGWGTGPAVIGMIGGTRHVLDDVSALDLRIVRREQGGRSSLDADDEEFDN